MDARHKFIIATLADALGLEESQIEDFVLVDEKVQLNFLLTENLICSQMTTYSALGFW